MANRNDDIVKRLRDDCYECQQEAADEIVRLRERVRFLENRIGDASVMLADWDGYYNPTTKRGNAEELASLIEDAYCTLQGKSWREIDTDSDKENTNG
jgi:hypothetical protein